MKSIYLYLIIGLGLATFTACSDDDSFETTPNGEWLIPIGQVFDGGPGKDGIPSVDDPSFASVESSSFLDPSNLVVGIVNNGSAKAYAHRILDWHEIVNDDLEGINYALTYCPLTGTAVAWDREINNTITTFGVSGKLYNTNLMPYDRATDSYWSQMRLDCVTGDLIDTRINTFPVIETTWETWQEMYPDSEIMTRETGFDRNYNAYPYGDYRTNNNNIIFPVSSLDNRLPAKDRVLAVLTDSRKKVYPIEEFGDGLAVMEGFGADEVIVLGSDSRNFLVAYKNSGLENVTFFDGPGPIVAEDSNGNKISISGEVVEGPLAGTQLAAVESILGYYFSLAAFYPDMEIME